MNLWEMIVLVTAIGGAVSIFRARHGVRVDSRGNELPVQPHPDADRLKDEVLQLKQRIAVLERLATDDNSARSLDREIEKLR